MLGGLDALAVDVDRVAHRAERVEADAHGQHHAEARQGDVKPQQRGQVLIDLQKEVGVFEESQ